MLRHLPVMVRALRGAALQGNRWRLAERRAEALARQAIEMGLVSVDAETRRVVGARDPRYASDDSGKAPKKAQAPEVEVRQVPQELPPESADAADFLDDFLGDVDTPAATAAEAQANEPAEVQAAPEPEPEPEPVDPADDLAAMMEEEPTPWTSTAISAATTEPNAVSPDTEDCGGSGGELVPQDQPNALVSVPNRADVLISTFGKPGDLVRYAGTGKRPRLVTYDVLDCTLGGGHHAAAILQEGEPWTRVVGIDCDFAVERTASALRETFGTRRFQFFQHRMSDIHDLFGDRAFDCVLIDPGPNMDQLDDLSRGFSLDISAGGDFELDMRYGPMMRSTAAQWLAHARTEAVRQALELYGEVPVKLAKRIATALTEYPRPRTGSELLACIRRVVPERNENLHPILGEGMTPADQADPMFAGHPWLTANATPMSRRSFVHRTLLSLRAEVNNERRELLEGLRQGFEVVRPTGRVIVTTRDPWQQKLVDWFAEHHPFALKLQQETIDSSEARELLQPPETATVTLQRTMHQSFRVKNELTPPSAEDLQRDYLHWLSGGSTGVVTRGYPAFNFGTRTIRPEDRKREAKLRRQAKQPPPMGRTSGWRLKHETPSRRFFESEGEL